MEKKKKKIAEEIEKIDAMGQEDEHKAVKWVKEAMKDEEKKEEKKEEHRIELLDESKKKVWTYKEQLLRFLHEMLREISFPKSYQWGVWYDGKGISISIIDKFGKKHRRAFIPTHDPKYDLSACYSYAVWAEDIVDAIEGNLETTTIWTPSKQN